MDAIFEKQNQRRADIKNRLGDYFDELDDVSNMCALLEESRQTLERVDWSRVSEEKHDEVLLKMKETVDYVAEQIKEMEAKFHLLCDFMEEALFSFILSCKQANQYDNEECQRVVKEELNEYKSFVLTIQERYGFERTDEQKAKRTKRLKEVVS